jgi:hypothetical protein
MNRALNIPEKQSNFDFVPTAPTKRPGGALSGELFQMIDRV